MPSLARSRAAFSSKRWAPCSRDCAMALIAESGLFAMTLWVPQAAAQPSDFREVILLIGSGDQMFGLTKIFAGLFELIGAELIFGELRQIARHKKQAVSLTPLRYPTLKVCQTLFLLSQFK